MKDRLGLDKERVKISKIQLDILRRMSFGWELGDSRIHLRRFLQNGVLGYGGETRNVASNTFKSLCFRGLIQITGEVRSGCNVFVLTEKGKLLLENLYK